MEKIEEIFKTLNANIQGINVSITKKFDKVIIEITMLKNENKQLRKKVEEQFKTIELLEREVENETEKEIREKV